MITVVVTVLLLSPHHPSILGNMELTNLTELNNIVKRQLTLGLEKLMEKIVSAFWVDLGYRLRSQNEGSTAGFPGMTGIHLILLLLLLLST